MKRKLIVIGNDKVKLFLNDLYFSFPFDTLLCVFTCLLCAPAWSDHLPPGRKKGSVRSEQDDLSSPHWHAPKNKKHLQATQGGENLLPAGLQHVKEKQAIFDSDVWRPKEGPFVVRSGKGAKKRLAKCLPHLHRFIEFGLGKLCHRAEQWSGKKKWMSRDAFKTFKNDLYMKHRTEFLKSIRIERQVHQVPAELVYFQYNQSICSKLQNWSCR